MGNLHNIGTYRNHTMLLYLENLIPSACPQPFSWRIHILKAKKGLELFWQYLNRYKALELLNEA